MSSGGVERLAGSPLHACRLEGTDERQRGEGRHRQALPCWVLLLSCSALALGWVPGDPPTTTAQL